jgi:hypothetical protein
MHHITSDPTDRRHADIRHHVLVAALVLGIGVVAAPVVAPSVAHAAVGAPSRYLPVEPCRLLDTREAGSTLSAGTSIDVEVTGGTCGVDADATAAVVTVTAVTPGGPGHVTLWPTGESRPETSVLNYRPGQVIANSQVVDLGDGGSISLYSYAAADLVVDVTGFFMASGATEAGRFVPVEARRLVDTRLTTKPAPRASVLVDPSTHPDVPSDALAVAVNITTSETSGPGHFTAYPSGSTFPLASVLNSDGPGQTRAAAAIVPIDDDGFRVFTWNGDHVIVDITGYFTGESAENSTDGRFVSTSPNRLVDTREPAGVAGGPRLWDDGGREFDITGVTGGPVAAIAASITMTDSEDAGWVVGGPARVEQSLTSSVNVDAAQRTVANSAIVPASDRGVQFTTLESTHLIVDIMGWFTGPPATGSGAAVTNEPNPDRRVTIISDSTMAGIRWNGALGGLQGFTAITDLESCRRLVAPSCRGREGYAPRSLVSELNAMPPVGPEDILVIGTGYDDWYGRFSSDFDIVVATARARGYHHIVWANFVVSTRYQQPGSLTPNYVAMNAVLAEKVASGRYPDVRVWDLNGYVAGTSGWFYSDGVHETRLGSWGVADWLSRHVRAFDDRPCAQPMTPGGPIDDPCPNPDHLPSTVGLPDIVGLYGL